MSSEKLKRNFLLYKCDFRTKRKVEELLVKENVEIIDGFDYRVYEIFSKRCRLLYERIKEYPQEFLRSWEYMDCPGFLVYVRDGEEMRGLVNSIKKRKLDTDSLLTYIRKGKVVLYYGETEWNDFECYVSTKRLEVSSTLSFYHTLPVLSEDVLDRKVNPLNANVIKVGAMSLYGVMPKYLSTLDTELGGRSIWNTQGLLDRESIFFNKIGRKVSLLSFYDEVVISSTNDLFDNDRLMLVPEILLTSEQVNVQNDIKKYFKSRKMSIIGGDGVTKIRCVGNDGSSHQMIVMFKVREPFNLVNSDLLVKMLLSSYVFDEKFEIKECLPMLLMPFESVSLVISDAMVVGALKKRRTFLENFSMNICVIANKGSLKSSFINICQEYMNDDVVFIDSDVYGRWIDKKMNDNDYKLDVTILKDGVSYFEVLADETLKLVDNKVNAMKTFGYDYATRLTDQTYGLSNFQNELFEFLKVGQRVVLFCHNTLEANCLSGNWQHFVVRPNVDGRLINRSRDLEAIDLPVNEFLYDFYGSIGGIRDTLQWVELFGVLFPDVLSQLIKHISIELALNS